MVKSRLIDLLIESGAIRFGEFTLASGRKSRYYIDIKTAVTSPRILRMISSDIIKKNLQFDVVAGVAVGGVPLAVAVSLACDKPYVIIRKEQKGHGMSGLVIGETSGRKVLLIEDVTTSGGSAVFGVENIRAAGGTLENVVTVVDRDEGAEDLLKKIGVNLVPLIRMEDLLQ
jgi:orotate phosphoribosyltransferase